MLKRLLNAVSVILGTSTAYAVFDSLHGWLPFFEPIAIVNSTMWVGASVLLLFWIFGEEYGDRKVAPEDFMVPFILGFLSPLFTYAILHETNERKKVQE